MKHARTIGIFALVAAIFSVPLACGSSTPAANVSLSVGGDGGAPPATPSGPCPPGQPCPPPQGSAAPLGSVATTDPNALATLLAAAAAAGSAWLGPAAAMGDPAEAGLRAAAMKYAPGMVPDGPVAKGTLSEGGHIGFLANMDPSKCYAIVAYGAGMTDLDVNLLAPPLYNFLSGQDGMAGPTAVIGGGASPMCPLIPLTVAWKVDLFAKKGGGQVAAQLYSKPK